MRPLPRARIEAAFIAACEAELEALKPGNVHVHADGHGMQVRDFHLSARVAAPHIVNSRLRVGARIRRAVEATVDAVGCNTNLGIILLTAPLAAAAQRSGLPLRESLGEVLAGLDVEDAAETFAAIRRASPAGLGSAKSADVANTARVTLREAMALAARRDRIARQYVTDYEDVFSFGIRALTAASRRAGGTSPDVVTNLHMRFLARFADSHIVRKHGLDIARSVASEARLNLSHAHPPISARSRSVLMRLDRDLKTRGLNPGTTADLVVGTLFAARIIAERDASKVQ
ncbi:MAG: triphosphoribosyl-dephospho-CoA synthase [Hyphomicrobium sp.]